MSEDVAFYTVTLARVYTDQGHLEKAADIYRYLLKREPDREDLLSALSVLESQMAAAQVKGKTDLVNLFGRWIDMIDRCNRFERLKTLQGGLKR